MVGATAGPKGRGRRPAEQRTTTSNAGAAKELKDKDLARQLRRCSVSVTLNVAEGMHSRGGNRTARYHTLGSAQETLACLEAAEACGYVAAVDATLSEQLKRIVGTLVKLVGAA